MPKFSIIRHVDDVEKNSVEDKKLFQSGIEMLLYFMKHLRPNIANMTQGLRSWIV